MFGLVQVILTVNSSQSARERLKGITNVLKTKDDSLLGMHQSDNLIRGAI